MRLRYKARNNQQHRSESKRHIHRPDSHRQGAPTEPVFHDAEKPTEQNCGREHREISDHAKRAGFFQPKAKNVVYIGRHFRQKKKIYPALQNIAEIKSI